LEKVVETGMDDRMKLDLRCTTCGKPLLVDRGGDKRVLRTRIIIFDNGTSLAKCPSCKAEVVVPIKLIREFPDKSAAQDRNAARRAEGASTPKRKKAGAPRLDQLAGDLETFCGPFSARVRTLLAGKNGRTTKAELEKLLSCMVHIHQLGELIEHVLNRCDSGAAIARKRTGDQFRSHVTESSGGEGNGVPESEKS
jgi:ribosomal protein S27E